MTIEEAINAHLKAQASITALVGARIYQSVREQSAGLPAITFDRLDGGASFQDISSGSVGLAEDQVDFTAYAADAKTAALLREYMRVALQNFVGAVMGGAGGVRVFGCLYESSHGGYEPDTQPPVYMRSVTFTIQYEQDPAT